MRVMKTLKSILGGIAGAVLATALVAEPTIRPLSRDDAAQLRNDAARAALAAFRPSPRPIHMIRYPVTIETRAPDVRPVARSAFHPTTRWEHKPGNRMWTRAAMSALAAQENGLDSIIPRDIESWCPAYEQNSPELRRAFWVGMMSALAKHESTYNPRAVGGGNLWFGLLQIYPPTARGYGCRATTGEALKNPADNLSCAARIMAVTVERDQAIAVHNGRWRGVAADWGPMTNRSKIRDMANWTRQQTYCTQIDSVRPQARPDPNLWAARISTRGVTSQSN